MNAYLKGFVAKLSRSLPPRTAGLVTTDRNEVYAVAANWAEAAAPVYTLGDEGWVATKWQVADFRHCPNDALAAHLEEMGYEDEGEVDALCKDAIEIPLD